MDTAVNHRLDSSSGLTGEELVLLLIRDAGFRRAFRRCPHAALAGKGLAVPAPVARAVAAVAPEIHVGPGERTAFTDEDVPRCSVGY